MGRFCIEIRCVTEAGEIFRYKKGSTCDLSLFAIRKGEGQIPRVKTTQGTCQEKKMEGQGQRTENTSRGSLGRHRGRAGFGRDQVN